jgi:hypothetical protein
MKALEQIIGFLETSRAIAWRRCETRINGTSWKIFATEQGSNLGGDSEGGGWPQLGEE